ncbi:hypothetical protein L0156_18690 [bacterium]|nr:hypothetical protein [bacterium]
MKMRKQFILDQNKIRTVRRILNARTDTEAVDNALNEVIANSKIDKLLRTVRGKGKIKDVYGRVAG